MTTSDRPTLSLAQLEAHDPRHQGRGAEQRFLCPLPACADHQGRDHKNLAANIETGLWRCCRCEGSGRLTERWEARERLSPRARARRAFGLVSQAARPVAQEQQAPKGASAGAPVPTWRKRWDQAVPVTGTPGADYLASRSVPEAIATAAGVRYLEKWGHWTKDDAGAWQLEGTSRRVVFPIVDQVGELVGIQGRAIDLEHFGEKMLTNGMAGVFATVGIVDVFSTQQVALVEAPIDGLSLAAVGIVALATCGTAWPSWLPRALAFKNVLLAHDNDEPDTRGRQPGDEAAAKLTPELRSWGAQVQRMRPEGAKDWNEVLQHGIDVLRLHVPNPGPQPEDDDDDDDDEDLPAAAQGIARQSFVPYAKVVLPEQADVDELLVWLRTAPRPATSFQLWPWARVGDVERFYAALEFDLRRGPTGPRWIAAVNDLRQLARMAVGSAETRSGLAEAA